jgi:nucleotide-binding universal stress UspA family protein
MAMDTTSQPASTHHEPSVSPRLTQAVGFRHILACIDRSPSSARCLAHALSLASTFGSAVTLLYVMQPPDHRVGPHATDALSWEIARQEATANLEVLEKKAARTLGRPVHTRLEEGQPSERIVALTREIGADLVVLGGPGDSDETAWSLGSTAQHVLGVARTSVLIARGKIGDFALPKHILVPLDGSLRTESVLPMAAAIAKAHGADLLLVHVVADPLPTRILVAPEDLALSRELAERLNTHATSYLKALRETLGGEGLKVGTLVARRADKRQFLIELSEKEQTDLIVLSAHGSTCNAARPFGSVTAHLLTHSMLPLLVLQDLPESELRFVSDPGERFAPPLRAIYPPEGA